MATSVRRMVAGALAALAMTTAAIIIPASPASAAVAASIHRIWFDSPGRDTGSNRSLNAEYIQIKNNRAVALNIGGFRIRDLTGHTYVVPRNVVLAAHAKLTLRTGRGTNTSATKYWGRSWYVWNNDRDRATLRSNTGAVLDRCSYRKRARNYVYC